MDTLKMQPQGSWSPSVNLSTLLTSVRLLMAEPNPDDGLMPDITEVFRNDRVQFEETAKRETDKHACKASSSALQAEVKNDSGTQEQPPDVEPSETREVAAPEERPAEESEGGNGTGDEDDADEYEDEYCGEDEWDDNAETDEATSVSNKRPRI